MIRDKYEKAKVWVKEHKTEVIVGSITLVGGVLIGKQMAKERKIEVFPDWAIKWRSKCDDNLWIYENGLPIFANEEQTAVYRDAISKHADWDHGDTFCGLEVIDRE